MVLRAVFPEMEASTQKQTETALHHVSSQQRNELIIACRKAKLTSTQMEISCHVDVSIFRTANI